MGVRTTALTAHRDSADRSELLTNSVIAYLNFKSTFDAKVRNSDQCALIDHEGAYVAKRKQLNAGLFAERPCYRDGPAHKARFKPRITLDLAQSDESA